MSPEPDHQPPALKDADYLSYTWADLSWSPWIPFTADKDEFRQIQKEPGIYRIRPAGQDFLMYIGETRKPLYQRLQNLRMELFGADQMPWADPHAESAALWAWRDAEAFEYECSVTPLDVTTPGRRAMESFLLYRYRQERGESPLCNFGRFHPRYRRSTIRKESLRGGKLAADQKDNPAGSPGCPPLVPAGTPGEPGWMGISWSSRTALVPETIATAPAGPGLYLLIDAVSQEICSIGQSVRCRNRLLDQAGKTWEGREMGFSCHAADEMVLPHHLKEMENDLVGNYFEQYRKAPEYQFRSSE